MLRLNAAGIGEPVRLNLLLTIACSTKEGFRH
jgi:hypothetical protein